MTIVAIYGFKAQYSGDSEYEWNHPVIGATHKCMLFLRQDSDSGEFETAISECRKYGFTDIEDLRYGKLQIEVLNTDLYRGFAGFYEQALTEGSTLVFYPNKGDGNGDAA
jgi:hypothetical protein